MAANPARELLQLCSLSWVPGFLVHRVPWPGPSVLPRIRGLGPAGAGCPSGFTPSDLAQPEVRLPPKGPSVPARQSGIPQGLSFLPTPILPADLFRRGNPGDCPLG